MSVLFRFLPGENREVFLMGVPARDVTLTDWDQLEDLPKKDLLSHARSADGLYEQVMTVADARKVGAPPSKPKAKKSMQTDPDVATPGRVDADVIQPGQAVPLTDEPISEGAPGFVQADTGPTNPQEG